MSDKLVPFPGRKRKARKCPICGRPPIQQNEPFCSKRCADEDLRRWLTGGYRIPTAEPPEAADEFGQDPEKT